MNQVIKILTDLCSRKWYGTLTLKLNNGKIVLIKKEETIKPDTD